MATLPWAPPLSSIKPMLFAEVKQPFDDPAWLHEIKYDGWRLLASTGDAELRTKNGADATKWFPEISTTLASLPAGAMLDGELCVLDDLGRADFGRLQARALMRRYRAGCDPVAYCVFDLLAHKGQDLRGLPLTTRKKRLEQLLKAPLPGILLVTAMPGDQGTVLHAHMKALGVEGIVSKRLDSVYRSGERTADWLKVKWKGAIPAQRFKRQPPA